jgi:alpha-mannosidase
MSLSLTSIALAGLLLATGSAAAQSRLTIESIEPTPLFPNGQPLKQVAWMQVDHQGPACTACRIKVSMGGAETVTQPFNAPPGVSRQRLLIPDIASPAELTVEIEDAGGHSLASHRQNWTPQRHWKIYVVHSSHEDLGYEDFIFRKQKDIADYMDLARRFSGPDGPASSDHYTLETMLFKRNYIEERSEMEWRDLVDSHVKTGRMPLMGASSGVHTQWMDYEELARSTYEARREARDRWGLDIKTFMMVDNPSASWSACQALADAGFRYLARWGQGWRTGGNSNWATTKIPALFWWVAPDGHSKLLYAWRTHYGLPFWYGQNYWSAGEGVEAAAQDVSRRLKEIEGGKTLGPYPYDALINPNYSDHEAPKSTQAALAAWNNAYRYPEIRAAGTTEFFEYIEKNFAAQLPSLSGELNNFSGDYSSIDPDSQGWKRRASRLLPLAEGLATIAGAFQPGFFYPGGLIERTYLRLFDYDEHSWPTQPLANDFHMFNAQWVKQREGERALTHAHEAVGIGFDELKSEIPNAGGRKLVVFNPLAHDRTDLVEAGVVGMRVVDPDTHVEVQVQRLPQGKVTFVAENVPAFGYKVFDIVPGSSMAKPVSSLTARLAVTSAGLENEFFKIEFDRQTGAIHSLFDKELGRELVDSSAAQQFNQMVYLHTKSPVSPEGSFHTPSGATLQPGNAGPIRADFSVVMDDATTGARITQTVILWARIKRIDIVDRIEHAKALYSDRYEDRYRDNIFYAFPVAVEGGQPRVEYAGGVVRPFDDQLRWGSHDYLNANRWVDVSNASYGVTMAPWEASAVSFGEIRYNHFSIDYKPSKPHLFSFAWSNRMAGLLTLEPADCNATLRYSFTSHAGDWQGPAPEFGWRIASPLEASVIEKPQTGPLPRDHASFVRISAPNIQLVTLKNSEQPGHGWILRLVETEGKDTDASIDLPHFDLGSAEECDLVENTRGTVRIDSNTLRLHMGKYAYATIRLVGREKIPAAPRDIQARPASDSEIALTWPASGAAAYNIYRSEDPKEPPTAYTLAGRATQNHFVDSGLKLDTTYYYLVAGVSRDNQQSDPSPQIHTRTSAQNRTAPPPVEDLGVVRRAKDTLILYWHKQEEPDVARYLVYRGDSPAFSATAAPVAIVEPTRFFLQIYRDSGLEPGHTYYYRVLAEDFAGNRQQRSPVAKSTTAAGIEK